MRSLWILVLVFPFSMISLDQISLNAQPLTTPQYIQQDYSPFWIDERYSVAIPDDMRQRIFDNVPLQYGNVPLQYGNVPLQFDNVPLQRDQSGQWPQQQTRQGANAQQEKRNAWYGSKRSYNQALEYSREQQQRLFQNAYPTPASRENQQGTAFQQKRSERQLQQGDQFYPRQSVDQAIRRNEEIQQGLYQGAYPETR